MMVLQLNQELNKAILDYRELEVRVFNPARDYLWPIPQAEIDATDGLVTQNPGGY